MPESRLDHRFLHAPDKTYLLGRWHPDRATWRGIRAELRSILTWVRRREGTGAKTRFLIFGCGRSGTTLLVSLLNSHPDIRCDGEVLHHAVVAPRAMLNRLASTSVKPFYGCKVLSYQISEVLRIRNGSSFLRRLVDDGFKIIHVHRNTLDAALSSAVANQIEKFHYWKGMDFDRTRIDVDEGFFVRRVRWFGALQRYEADLLSCVEHHTVDYDRDLRGPAVQQATVDKLCDALGAGRAVVTAGTVKMVGDGGPITIGNRTNLFQALRSQGLDAVIEEHDRARLATGS